ncbi:hypothetical protein [Streptomyces sp. KMM 9044]|nr:hypothetical protein [Streptomyces sp. KMM 9044]WAX76674.1 hypothetical protein HUV60_002265 [Streptomyces sp. KMM 9044]
MTSLVLALVAGAVVGLALGGLGGGGSVLAVSALRGARRRPGAWSSRSA